MWVGKYQDGRDVTYDEGAAQFAVGGTAVTVAQVLEYDAFEQIQWSSAETRAWARGLGAVAPAETPPQDPSTAAQTSASATVDAAKRGWFARLPWWGKALFVLVWPISVSYGVFWMWKDKKFSQVARIALTAGAALLFIVAIVNGGTEDGTDSTSAKSESKPVPSSPAPKEAAPATAPEPEPVPVAEKPKPAPSGPTEAQKKAFLAFEKRIYATEKPATSAIKTFQASAKKFDKGDATLYEVYDDVTDAKDACSSVQMAYWELEPPKDLPEDVRDLLDDALQSLSTSYMTQSDAFKAFGKYLDEQKMSEAEKYQEKMDLAQSFNLEAVAKVMEAREKMGIPLDAK